MWVLLSSRLRSWLLLAVALPLFRLGLHRVATAVHQRNPDSTASSALQRADRLLGSASRRGRGKD